MSKKSTTTAAVATAHDLTAALIAMFEPIVAARKELTGVSTGPEQPVDPGVKFIIGGMCNNVYHQLRGQMVGKDGTKFRNAKEFLDESQSRLQALFRKHGEDDAAIVSDPDYHRTVGYYNINNARFSAYHELLDSLCEVYQHFVGQPFEYKAPAQTAVGSALTEAAAKAAAAKLASIRQQVAATA